MFTLVDRELHADQNSRYYIIAFLDSTPQKSSELFLVFEKASFDLSSMISKGEFKRQPRLVLQIYTHVLLGAKALHKCGIVHRDLKPGNILVFDLGQNRYVAKIGDLGFASITETAPSVAGTLTFLPPEYLPSWRTAFKLEVDEKVDMWSIGVLFITYVDPRAVSMRN